MVRNSIDRLRWDHLTSDTVLPLALFSLHEFRDA